MRKIIFIRGIPGSGKSTLAKEIVSNYNKSKFKIVDPESLSGFSPTYEGIILKKFKYRENLKQCIRYLKDGYDVIWTQAWRNINGLQLTMDNINTLLDFKVDYIVLEKIFDFSLTWERVKHKFKGYTKSRFTKQYITKQQTFNIPNVKYFKVSDVEEAKKALK